MSPEFEQIRQEVEELTRNWSDIEWQQAPDGKWSGGQILEHLRLTYTGTTKGLLKVLEGAQSLGGKPTWPDRLRTFVVTRVGYIPANGIAPHPTVPGTGLTQHSIRRFYDALVAMDATLSDAERRFGSRTKILDHPKLGLLNAAEWRRFHRRHAKHHLKQAAERIRIASSAILEQETVA